MVIDYLFLLIIIFCLTYFDVLLISVLPFKIIVFLESNDLFIIMYFFSLFPINVQVIKTGLCEITVAILFCLKGFSMMYLSSSL